MKKLLLVVMIIALIIPAGQAFAAATTETTVQASFVPMHYLIDGIDYAPPKDQLGFIYNDSTYVPLRFVGNILNKTVTWDGELSRVSVAAPKSNDWVTIREELSALKVENSVILPVDGKKISKTAIKITFREVSYEFDGKLVQPNAKTPGFIYGGRLFVPLRFMYESLGFDPTFDQSTYTITTATDAVQLAYQQIVKDNDVLITEKIAACESTVLSQGFGFLSKKSKMTEEEIEAAYQTILGVISSCRSELNVMLDNLTKQLTDSEQSTDVVAEYGLQFDATEADAIARITKIRQTE